MPHNWRSWETAPYGDGWVYYEFVRIPKAAETASAPAVEAPKVQNELFKQVPYLDRLFAIPNREPNTNNPPWEEYRLNRGPRLICHQGPIETNGYFGIHLTRRVEDRVVTCSFGGTSYRMYWKFLGRVPFPAGEAGDVYEIKRRAPANAENPVLSSRIVVYRGSRVKVFDDGNPSVIIEAPNFQDPAPEIADGKLAVAAMIKKLEGIRSLECQLTIAERDQPEKTLQYYRRGDQVCLQEAERCRILWDFKSNRVMSLDLVKKTAAVLDLNLHGLASLSDLRNQIDFLTVLRSLAEHPARYELTDKIQDRYCDLYHVTPSKGSVGRGPFAVWLNQTTHLPGNVQGCLADHGGTFSLDNFRWNSSLKDSLFSFEIPSGFTTVDLGDAQKSTRAPSKEGAGLPDRDTLSQSNTWPSIRIKAGNGPSAEIIERPLKSANGINTFKLGSAGMEWEVTCQGKGKREIEAGPSPEVFELEWKFKGDHRLPSQRTGSQTGFLFGKATKVVDDPGFSIELIPRETNAKIASAPAPKTRLSDTADQLITMKSAILSTKTIYEDKSILENTTFVMGMKSREVSGPENNRKIILVDGVANKCVRLNERLKIACIGNNDGYGYKNYNEINSLRTALLTWGHEYIYSETINNKTCDLYRIWRTLPSTIPDNYLTYLWIDQVTKLPVRKSGVSPSGVNIVTEIQWGLPLAESLFSMEIPSGYTVTSYEEFMKQWTLAADQTKKVPANDPATGSESSTPRKQGILAKLQGRWKPVQAFHGLARLSEDSSRREYGLEITGDKLEFVTRSDGSRSWMTVELNNDENPFQLDLVRDHVSTRCVGVVEGNRLRLCQGAAFRQAKKAEPTEGLKYAEYERIDRWPYEEPKTFSTSTADKRAANSNGDLRIQMTNVLEPYQGEWVVSRCVDENLQTVEGSKPAKPDEPWIVFGESFTIAGMAADHVQTVFTVPGKPIKIELVFKRPIGDSTSSAGQRELRIPSIWNLEGEQLRVILGKEGKDPEKLEPTLGFKYFELARAEKKPRPKPSNLASSGASTGPQSENPDKPNGAGPNLVIVQTAPGDAGRTVEPMGQDERQMVRIVGNVANRTEIRWSYQGKLSFEPGFEVPIYELQWKYLGTHPPALQKEGSKTVYFQGLPIKLALFSSIQFTVESALNEPRLTVGSNPKSSFDGMIERLSQAKSCILDHQIFEKTDKASVSNVYWIKNQSIRFCNSYGFEKTIKDDRSLNKRLTLITSGKLAREVILPKDQQLYIGEIKDYFEYYKTRKSKFLYSTTIDSKKCDIYQALPKENEKDSAATQPLFWIEQGTNLPLRLREPGFSGNYHDVQFQLDVPIDEAAFSAEIPPGFALEKKGEIDRLERRYLDWYQRGLKIGVPLPNFKNLQAEKKAKAAEIQGTWQVVKKINEDFRDEKIADSKKQTWTIQGDELTSGGDGNQKARIDVVDIWPIFSVNFIPQSTGLPNNLGFPQKASGRIPSLWSLQGGKLRVAIGKAGQPLWKLEPAVGVQYFELVRKAEGPSELEPRAASPSPETIVPKGKGPNLVIVYSVPGDTWKTVEPMGQDPRQMVRVVGNEANQTEIRWAYQGMLVLADGSKIPVYEFQWKYFGTATNFKKPAMLKRVYIQGKQVDLGEFLGLSFHVEPNDKDVRLVEGVKVNSSFDAAMEQIARAKTCISEEQTYAGTERVASSRTYWAVNRFAEFDNRRGLETISKCDRILNKRITLLPSMKLAREEAAPKLDLSYEGHVGAMLKWFKGQKAEFLHAETVGERKCDIYQVYPKIEEIARTGSASLLWIEQNTNRLMMIREDLPSGNFRTLTLQMDAAIEESLLAMKIPADHAVDHDGEVTRQIRMVYENEKRGLKFGQPVPKADQLQVDIKKKTERLQGDWIPIKIIGEDFRNVKIVDWEKSMWTIRQGRLTTGGDAKTAQRMDVLEPWPIFQVEFVRDFLSPNNLVFPSKTGVRIPSLWSLEGDLLRVAIGEEGHVPMKLEPAAGVRYFELVRFNGADLSMDPGASALEPQELKALKARIGSFVAGANGASPAPNSQGALSGPNPSAEHLLSSLPLRTESAKQRILAALEGEWVTNMEVVQDTKGAIQSGKPGITWTIRGDSFVTDLNPDQPARMVVVDTNGPIRIEFLLPVSLPRSDGAPSLRIIRVPSLWTLVGNQLKVAIGTEGQKLDRLEPAPGVKYFELVRKPMQAKSNEALPQNAAQPHWLFSWAQTAGTANQAGSAESNRTSVTDPTQGISDKNACFQKMLERLEKVQSASFDVNFASLAINNQPPATQRHWIRGDKIRIEKMIEGKVLITTVFDSSTKKGIDLNSVDMVARRRDLNVNNDFVNTELRNINFISMITTGFLDPKNNARYKETPSKFDYIKTENFEGRSCNIYWAFPSEIEHEKRGGPWLVWIDRQQQLPVLIRGQTQFGIFDLTDFRWNPKFDDSLFSQEIPEGFQITTDWVDAWQMKLAASFPQPSKAPPARQNPTAKKEDATNRALSPAGPAPK